MRWLSILLTSLVSSCATVGSDSIGHERDPLNVLWIIAEDLGPELSCYGHPEVHTPTLDRLADEGVRYTRAFSPTGVCSTSRSSFMTGMYCHSIGAHHHRSHRNDGFRLPDGVRVLTDWLRPAGYATANLVRLTNDPKEKFLRGTGKTDWNFHYEGGQKAAFDFDRWDDLRRHTPFYAQINFAETHRGRAWNRAHERIEQPADPDRVVLPPYYPDHSVARADWAQYLNTVMALDRKVAHVLDRLERDGLADDTVVIFFADHGRAHIRGKQWVYDSGTRVPLIIRWARSHPPPSGFVPGSVDDRLVSTIDLTATTLSIAGLENPPALQGRVFLGPDDEGPRQYVFAGRDRGDETVDRVRTVRDTRYRYLRNYHPDQPLLQLNRYKEATYPMLPLLRELASHDRLTEVQARLLAPTRPPEELYDTKLDPHEVHNLAESAEHAEHLARLRRALDAWIERIDDQGRVREDPEVVARYLRQMQRNYDRRIRKIYQRKGLPSPLDDG